MKCYCRQSGERMDYVPRLDAAVRWLAALVGHGTYLTWERTVKTSSGVWHVQVKKVSEV